MDKVLIEIGAEEIPAGYIEPALAAFSATVCKKLTDARITFSEAKVFGTPRRLAILINGVAERQTPLKTEVVGPPESVGFDDAGRPTVAAEKFAEKVGISVDAVRVTETPKGRYLCADQVAAALPTVEVLAESLPGIVAAVPFPKTMKWADLDVTFTRPVHWIIALYGDTVIPFTYGNVESGRVTYGHRFLSPNPITIGRPEEYVDLLRDAKVIADLDERRTLVLEEVARIAGELGGDILPDEELVDINKNLVEYPVASAGRFEESFLEVPDEVLITAMREHQKYFSVMDGNGKLMPCFIPVNNTEARDMDLVGQGHERVIRARLSDARFFFKGDVQSSMDDWTEKLKAVLFQAKLGSMHDKVVRVRRLAEYLADAVSSDAVLKTHAARAAWLAKSDLVSQVVVEFPKLQGVMGRIYAGIAGEPDAVAAAIEEHYRPIRSGGRLPETAAGAILAIADKIDSICGCFSVGLLPTGASDPYALRRQGIGVLQIMNRHGFGFSLKTLIDRSVALFEDKREQDAQTVAAAVYDFLKNRMAHILEEEGLPKDVVAAVSDISIDHVPHVWRRAEALQKLKARPDFDSLAVAFKRVVNIIKKSDAAETVSGTPDAALFEDASEEKLHRRLKEVAETVTALLARGDHEKALLEVATLREPVDAFFDGVMVMAEDAALRNNRLRLLKEIADLFAAFADFSKLST